jgi:hypothetical protein
VPERVGLEWLDPERKESIETPNGVVGGWRSWGYVVRPQNSGTFDLGEVELSYWDPATKKYEVTRASLGTIQVEPALPTAAVTAQPAADAPSPAKADPLDGLAGPRTTLTAFTAPSAPRLQGSLLWLVLAAPPLLVGVFSAGSSAARRLRARREGAASPAVLAEKALADARAAEERGDTTALLGAVERAIHLAIEAATGLKSRGVLLADLAAELERLGVRAALARDVEAALTACEAIRFEPEAGGSGGAISPAARELHEEAVAIAAELGRHRAP